LGICWMLLTSVDKQGYLPPNINDDQFDGELPDLNWVKAKQKLLRPINSCQSNSFAFGGNNISLLITRS